MITCNFGCGRVWWSKQGGYDTYCACTHTHTHTHTHTPQGVLGVTAWYRLQVCVGDICCTIKLWHACRGDAGSPRGVLLFVTVVPMSTVMLPAAVMMVPTVTPRWHLWCWKKRRRVYGVKLATVQTGSTETKQLWLGTLHWSTAHLSRWLMTDNYYQAATTWKVFSNTVKKGQSIWKVGWKVRFDWRLFFT